MYIYIYTYHNSIYRIHMPTYLHDIARSYQSTHGTGNVCRVARAEPLKQDLAERVPSPRWRFRVNILAKQCWIFVNQLIGLRDFKGTNTGKSRISWEKLAGFRLRFSLFCQPIE